MYNVPPLPSVGASLEYLEKAQALFPEGQPLAVLEPFFKCMLDGTYGIRVDNPAEVIPVPMSMTLDAGTVTNPNLIILKCHLPAALSCA
jgi:hypothetical protein